MKSLGIVRRMDDLGRVVIPKETRRILEIEEGDALEIFTDNERIVLQKYQPGCVFCSSVDNTQDFHGKHVCRECISKLSIPFSGN